MGLHAETDGNGPLDRDESARILRTEALPDVELLFGSYRRFSFAKHFHEGPALGVVESGAMRLYCNGAEQTVPAGSIVLLNAGDVHAPRPAEAGGWQFRMLYLEPAMVAELAAHWEQKEPMWFGRSVATDSAVFAALARLHRQLETAEDRMAAESELAAGLERVAKFSQWRLGGYRDAGGQKVERAKEYLRAYWRENVTIAQLAAAVELSPYHLVRSFHERVGIPPHTYLMQVRIENSRALLNGGATIADTALQAGFVDQSHFTRHFKKFTGVTPGRYLTK